MKTFSAAFAAAVLLSAVQASAQLPPPAPAPFPGVPLAPAPYAPAPYPAAPYAVAPYPAAPYPAAPYAVAPYAASPFLAPLPRYRSGAMRTTGIVLTAIALAHLGVGFAMFAAAPSQPSCQCDISQQDFFNITAIGLVTVGALFSAVGVPLWVVGALPPKGAPAAASLVPSLAGGKTPGLRWTF